MESKAPKKVKKTVKPKAKKPKKRGLVGIFKGKIKQLVPGNLWDLKAY